MALMVALVLLGWLSSTAIVWLDTGRVERLQDQIGTLQANRDAWVKAGMLGKISSCDPGNRPCIQLNKNAGAFGSNGDYRIIKGY